MAVTQAGWAAASTISTDGMWLTLSPPSWRIGHTIVYDSRRARMIMFGGGDGLQLGSVSSGTNEVWTLALVGAMPVWSKLAPLGTAPPGRACHTAIYDPVRDRMLVFGGVEGLLGGQGTSLNDVWELSLTGTPTWTALAPTGTPPTVRYDQAAAYDPIRDRMILYGGIDKGTLRNDVWALNLSGAPSWSQLTPAGPAPLSRAGHSIVYDPTGDRMLVFGGYRTSNAKIRVNVPDWTPAGSTIYIAGDFQGWNPGSPSYALAKQPDGRWTIALGLPAGTNIQFKFTRGSWGTVEKDEFGGEMGNRLQTLDASITYDCCVQNWADVAPASGAPYCFSSTFSPPCLNDVWALSLSGSPAWSLLGSSGTSPAARYGQSAIYDPARNSMLVFGGFGPEQAPFADVHELQLSGAPAWTDLSIAGTVPPARGRHAGIYDPVNDRMILFGGGGTEIVGSDDLWALSLSGTLGWSLLTPAWKPPPYGGGRSAIFDPVRQRMILFGGAETGPVNDVWTVPMDGTPSTQLVTSGTPPTGRYFQSAIYDPVRDRMIVFGGFDGAFTMFHDVWALSLSGTPTWSLVTPTGSPPAGRELHSAIYDPVRDRMIVFGGLDGVTVAQYNDAWALSLTEPPAWTQLLPLGTPPAARYNHSAIYDPVRDRMIVSAGQHFSPDVVFGDVWELSLSGPDSWTELHPTGTPTTAGYSHLSIYDPVRDRMVMFGGTNDNDPWALSLSGTSAWTPLAPDGPAPQGGFLDKAVYWPQADRMILLRGAVSQLWALSWQTPAGVTDAHPHFLELSPPYPNPSHGEVHFRLNIAVETRVTVDVFDLSGRRVARLLDGQLRAGRHTVQWRGHRPGTSSSSGVYFLRVLAGHEERGRAFVMID